MLFSVLTARLFCLLLVANYCKFPISFDLACKPETISHPLLIASKDHLDLFRGSAVPMQGDQKFCPRKPASPIAYDLGGYTYNIPMAPPGEPTSGPAHGMGINTTNATKSFIIFDQTDEKCRIMFYPSPANKFSYPNFDFCSTYPLKCGKSQEDSVKESSSLKEDTRDIDALLSLEDEEENEDDEEVSTGRTMGNNYGSSSPDSSCSTDGSKSSKSRLSSMHYKSCASGSSSDKKQQKMKKLMKVLRGIVPGGDQMDAAAVLDEAVRYLKSLKMEVKKLGIRNLKKHR